MLNVTFQDVAKLIWKQGQTNELDGQIWFHYASLSFSGVQQLVYQEGGLGQISVNSVAFAFVPVQGDITGDGIVDIYDLRAVAVYFDVKQGDPLWSAASAYDLNGNGVIDIYDWYWSAQTSLEHTHIRSFICKSKKLEAHAP